MKDNKETSITFRTSQELKTLIESADSFDFVEVGADILSEEIKEDIAKAIIYSKTE